jgi:hypothetical protein
MELLSFFWRSKTCFTMLWKINVRNTSCCKSALHRKTKENCVRVLIKLWRNGSCVRPIRKFFNNANLPKTPQYRWDLSLCARWGQCAIKKKKQLIKLEAPHIEILNRWVSSELFSLSLFYESQPQSRQSAKLFSSRRHWDSPNPSPTGECAPSPLVPGGGAHSLAREGLGESQFRRWDIYCGTYFVVWSIK